VQLADELRNANIPVFPCRITWDETKKKYTKQPAVPKNVHWSDAAQQNVPGDYSTFGIPIPQNVLVLDHDSYKDGCSREAVEAFLGCALPWDQAYIQTTISGGQHYAFQAPNYPVLQRGNIGNAGLDLRVGGKGFICSGNGYQPGGLCGLQRLNIPQSMPPLPDACRVHFEDSAPLQQAANPPPNTPNVQEAVEILKYFDPGELYDGGWIEKIMALRHEFDNDVEVGHDIAQAWSSGEYWPDGEPANYDYAAVDHQYHNGVKADRPGSNVVTFGTLVHKAKDLGYVPPVRLTVDASAAFAAQGLPDNIEDLQALIHATAGTPGALETIIGKIQATRLNEFDLVDIRAVLESSLKELGQWSKATRTLVDKHLSPKTETFDRPAIQLPDTIDIEDLPPTSLGFPTGEHGNNAKAMVGEVFGNRIAVHNGVLRWWSGIEWQQIPGDTLFKLTLNALMPNQCKVPNATATIAALPAYTAKLGDCKRDARVYFKDCVFDAATGQTLPHNINNFNTGTLQTCKGDNLDAPQWFAFLNQIFGGLPDEFDRVALLQEIMGWALIQDDLNVQKMVALDGATSGGKSVILEILRAILGDAKCGPASFSDIDNGKTQSSFIHKDVIIDSEAKPPNRQTLRAAIGFMNKMISNEHVSIQLLNTQQPWTGRLNCKMFIGCNGIPALIDDSGATTRRFVILYFSRSFADKQDRGLLSKLLPELPSIASWALQGAMRIVSSNGVFTTPASSREALGDLKNANEPLIEFIETYFEFGIDKKCHSGDIWGAYRMFALDSNIKLGTKNIFLKSLKQALNSYPCEHVNSLRMGDKVSTGYNGLGIRTLEVGAPAAHAAFTPSIVK